MLWMKHNVKQIAITYWVENCEQVLISSMNSNMDQSWRSSEKERFDGVCLTCGQVCFVCWEERWKKHLMHFIFLHEAPPPPPHPYLKWISIWLACHNQDSNCTRPKKRLLPNIFVLRENNGYVQLSLLWKTSTNLFLWWSNIRWSFTSSSMLLLALKFKKKLNPGRVL